MTRISLNGSDREIPDGLTVEGLLVHLDLNGRPLLIEHNGVALLKSEWAEKVVRDNDRIELVQVVAGG